MRVEIVTMVLLTIALVGEVLSLYALVKMSQRSTKEWMRVFTIVVTSVLGTLVGLTVIGFFISLFGVENIMVTTGGN